MSAHAVKKKSTLATKVVEIYQEGTMSVSVVRTIIAVVPEKWTEEEIEDHLEQYGSDVAWDQTDEEEPDFDITQVKEIAADDEGIDEDWSQ